MALSQVANNDTGLQARNKINAGFTAIDALGAATSNVNNTSDADKPVSTAQQAAIDAKISLNEKAAINGVATLGADGKIPTAQLPALATVETYVINSQAAMLALDAQRGDQAVRTDLNKTFSLAADPATTLANWIEHLTPTDLVLSVAGRTGTITLTKADVGLNNLDNTADANKPVSVAQQTALDLKQGASVVLTFLSTATAGTAAAVKTLLALVKGDVGLGNVDNTSDTNKPVSTAQQTAFDSKGNLNDTIITVATTTYTLLAADNGKIHEFTNAAGCTVTGPNTLPAGWNAILRRIGAAQVVFAAGAGATVVTYGGLKTVGQYGDIAVSVRTNAGTAAAYHVGGGVA